MATKIKIDSNDKKKSTKKNLALIISIVINVILIEMLIIGFWHYGKEFKKLKNANESLTQSCYDENGLICGLEYATSIDEAQYLEDNIVFVRDEYSSYYYSYSCMNKLSKGKNDYLIYDKKTAISKGYEEGKC